MSTVNIELDANEYQSLLKLVYFADYCANAGYLRNSLPSGSKVNQLCASAVAKLYSSGSQLGLPSTLNLTSFSQHLPFTEEELQANKAMIESDLEHITAMGLAQSFAESEVDSAGLRFGHEGGWITRDDLIMRRMRRYVREFEENGFENLRFRMFHSIPDDD